MPPASAGGSSLKAVKRSVEERQPFNGHVLDPSAVNGALDDLRGEIPFAVPPEVAQAEHTASWDRLTIRDISGEFIKISFKWSWLLLPDTSPPEYCEGVSVGNIQAPRIPVMVFEENLLRELG